MNGKHKVFSNKNHPRLHDQIEDPDCNEEEEQDVSQHENTSKILQLQQELNASSGTSRC